MSHSTDTTFDLGLMGGMFDPVHKGHLSIARTILEHLELDEMHLLPCGNPVHRDTVFTASEHRLAMLKIATGAIPGIEVDSRECQSDEPSYTLNSLRAIRKESPESRLFFVLGADAFNSLEQWFCWRDILEETHLVIAGRPGFELQLKGALLREFNKRRVTELGEMKAHASGKIMATQFELQDISSTVVRERLLAGENIDQLLPVGVADYIAQHKLYSTEAKV